MTPSAAGGEGCTQCTFTGGTCVVNIERVTLCRRCSSNDWYNPLCTDCDEPQLLCANASRTGNRTSNESGTVTWFNATHLDDVGLDQQTMMVWVCVLVGLLCPCFLGVTACYLYRFWWRKRLHVRLEAQQAEAQQVEGQQGSGQV